eukprot:CAMPEP_0117550206 /NCGR_PEP_ID=MMETSP0784-20121206/48561_1 /TAXON_ID=39447 /ORGANISM="" /LENGTH=391 /DNA_ID=CAMNT_0005347217 /DNA_START=58 /DNA_END=1234 /DNA_ORIENTATION=+
MAERAYRDLLESFSEVRDEIVPLEAAHDGQIVHFQATDIDANVSDSDFGVTLQGVLTLSRNTEYCQWEEASTTKTDAQNRTYTEYYYIKRWRDHRIPSLHFDQPAAHHNPLRDPFPSHVFAASAAVVEVRSGRTAILGKEVIANTRALKRRVDWTLGAVPKKSWSWWPWAVRTRYEAIASLAGAETSRAARLENFVYVGQGGYFFSPYAASTTELMAKYFFQYIEGTLLDWQLGDLMPTCTAGDVRVSYSVQDPEEISVVGEARLVHAERTGFNIFRRRKIGPPRHRISLYVTPKGHQIGMVHAGFSSLKDMMDAEIHRQRLWCLLARIALVFPAGLSSALLGRGWSAAFGLWCLGIAGLLTLVWGPDSTAVSALSFQFASLPSIVAAATG